MLEMKRRQILVYIPIDLYACHLLGGLGWGEAMSCRSASRLPGCHGECYPGAVFWGQGSSESGPPLGPNPCLVLWDSVAFSASFCSLPHQSPCCSLLHPLWLRPASLWVMWGGLIHGQGQEVGMAHKLKCFWTGVPPTPHGHSGHLLASHLD